MVLDETDDEQRFTTDAEHAEAWLKEAGVVPVRDGGEIRFVDEDDFDPDRRDRVDWDEVTGSERVVVYRERRGRDRLEVRRRDEVVADLDEDGKRQLDAGGVISRSPGEIGTTSTEKHEAMTPERVVPTDDDQGKSVVDTEGAELGVVTAVEGERIYVEAHPGLAEKTMAKLGWSDADEDDYVFGPDGIALITDDRVEVVTPE